VPAMSLAGFEISGDKHWYWIVAVLLSVSVWASLNLIDSPFGRALRALHGSEVASKVVGVDVVRYKVAIFVLSAVFASIMGSVTAHYVGFVTPNLADFFHSIELVTMVVIGGMASVYGSVVGAVLLTALPQALTSFEGWETVIFGAILMLCMIFLPKEHASRLACEQEMERAIKTLGLKGVSVASNINGKPLDLPDFEPFWASAADMGIPVFIHPNDPAGSTDRSYEAEYDLIHNFGWPYETTIAMARLVFAGIFDLHPNLKIITHHLGAMLPYFEGRAGFGLDQLGSRTDDPDDAQALGRLRRRPLDYFRMFYGDTALFGAIPATECGLAFFGADQILFGTDMPFDPEKGPGFIRETIRCIDRMRASAEEKTKIYEGNARRLLKLKLP